MDMTKLFHDCTFTVWQTGMLKLTMMALGLTIGCTWPHIFKRFRVIMLVIAAVGAIYLTTVYFGQVPTVTG